MSISRIEPPTWAMVLLLLLVAATGYGVFGDPPVGTVGSCVTTVVLLGLAVWIGKRGRNPSLAFGSGVVISFIARALLESGSLRSLLAGGLWVAVTYWLCDNGHRDKSRGARE